MKEVGKRGKIEECKNGLKATYGKNWQWMYDGEVPMTGVWWSRLVLIY